MKGIRLPVILATLYVAFFGCLVLFQGPVPLIMLIFGLSPVVLIWMVIRVLKDGHPSGDTFDEKFYDDSSYRRTNASEGEG